MSQRPTLDSVAAHARVSRQTVSNAINAPHLLHPATLARVQAAIDAVRYRPRRAARSLRTSRSQLVGVGLRPAGDGINGYVLDRFLHGLTESAEQAGYHVLLFPASDDDSEISAYDDLLVTHDLDAFVLTGTHHGDRRTAWLAERNVPFVTFGRPWGTTARHSWVDVDGAAGTREVTKRLLDVGHRRIAFVGWPEGSGVGDDRLAGWSRAMSEAGAPVPDLLVRRTDGVEGGRSAVELLLARPEPPTALVCVSDSVALGVFNRLTLAGRAPGHELPVIGFDDTPVAAALKLTSLAQPLAQAASECMRLLLDLLEPGPLTAPQPAHVLLDPHLAVRSTGGEPVSPVLDRSSRPRGGTSHHPEGALT